MPIENRPDEIAELHERGLWALEHAQAQEPREAIWDLVPILRLWHCPAFGAQTSWTLFAESGRPRLGNPGPSMHVREMTWDRPHDMGRFADLLQGVREGFGAPPTIRTRDAEVHASQVTAWLHEVSQLGVPVLGIEGPWGLDGESFGVETFNPYLRIRLEWWGDGPEAWHQLIGAVARLKELLLDHLGGVER